MTIQRPNKVYVASSWRNIMQVGVVAALRAAKIDCYDFKNPPDGSAFHWSAVMPGYARAGGTHHEQVADLNEYLVALQDPIAQAGYDADFSAMEECDACILVLPCGRSAHLELGWFVGQGKRTAILMDGTGPGEKVVPELMYKMVDFIAPSFISLLGWCGIED